MSVPISTKNMELWLQKQASAGAALETAMKRYGGIKGTLGYVTTQDPFSGQGSRATDSITPNTELGSIAITTIQDFNSIHLALDSLKGFATPALVTDSTLAYERTWSLLPTGIITPARYTGIYGVATRASKAIDVVFNSLGLTINRGQLAITTAAIAQKPTTGATKPTEGVTHKYVAAQPISPRAYSFYLDNAAEDYGTTHMLAAYEGGVTFGDTWAPDWTVNHLLPSYNALVENEEVEHSARLTLGMGSEEAAHIGEWEAGTRKFLRFEAIGPEIETDINYTLRIDLPILIEGPSTYGTAPGSPTVTLPFSYRVTTDPETGSMGEVYLVNTVA